MPAPAYRLVGGALKIINGGNYSHAFAAAGRVAYPIAVDDDTTFLGANFAQAAPHTAIFALAPGVRLIFGRPPLDEEGNTQEQEGCNLVNVTVPDGAEMHRPNNAQLVPVEVAGERGRINTLHECDRCAAFVPELRVAIDSGEYDRDGGRLDLLKDRARVRREDQTKRTADLDAIKAENAEAITRNGGTRVVADGGGRVR